MDARFTVIAPRKRFLVLLLPALVVWGTGCRGGGGSVDRDLAFAMRSARASLWNEAAYRWERALVARPDDAKIHNNLGVAYEHEGRYEDARREYKAALQLLPEDDHIRKNYEAFENFFAAKPLAPDAAKSAGGEGSAEGPKIEEEQGGKEGAHDGP